MVGFVRFYKYLLITYIDTTKSVILSKNAFLQTNLCNWVLSWVSYKSFWLEFSFALLKVLLKNPWPELNKSLQSLIGWNSLPLFLYLIIKNTPAKNTQVFWVHWQISYNGRFSGGKITVAFFVWRQMVQRQTLQRQNYGSFFHPIGIN